MTAPPAEVPDPFDDSTADIIRRGARYDRSDMNSRVGSANCHGCRGPKLPVNGILYCPQCDKTHLMTNPDFTPRIFYSEDPQ